MAKIIINKVALKATFDRQKPKFKTVLDSNMIPTLEGEKQNMLEELENHKISNELMNEREVHGKISLYGLIGFDQDGQDDPVGDLVKIVDEQTIIPLKSSSINVQSVDTISGKYTIIMPDLKDLDSYDEMGVPWLSGSNWVRLIEKGVPFLAYFLRGTRFSTSRSGHGIQSKHRVRDESSLKGRPYLSEVINNFKERLLRRSQTIVKDIRKYNVRDLLGRFSK